MDFIFQNQELIVTVISLMLTWLIAIVWKKNANRAALVAVLHQILDLAQDIANSPSTRDLDDASKKQYAVTRVEATLPARKVKLVQKVFGTVGGAVEFVWKNRKMLIPALTKLIKVVF